MEYKQLYNIETDTLITLIPKHLELVVKQDFTLTYFLDTYYFAILYLLFISHPNVLEIKDFEKMLTDFGLNYPGRRGFIKQMSSFKKLLRSYGLKDLIIKVGVFGYAISNKWVPPKSHTKISRKQRFVQLNKLVESIFASQRKGSLKNLMRATYHKETPRIYMDL